MVHGFLLINFDTIFYVRYRSEEISPGVNSLASRSSQSEVMPIFVRQKTLFLGVFLDEISFPGQTVDFRL